MSQVRTAERDLETNLFSAEADFWSAWLMGKENSGLGDKSAGVRKMTSCLDP